MNIWWEQRTSFEPLLLKLWVLAIKERSQCLHFAHTVQFFPQLDPRGRKCKQWNHAQNKNKVSKERKISLGKEKMKKNEGLSKHLFCGVRFKFAVDLLLPHETSTAQRKRRNLSKSFSEKTLDGPGCHPTVNTGRLVNAWVMSWTRGLVWCYVLMPAPIGVCMCVKRE